ncbi:hypothetical protein pb186bvf_007925 [Paramecium bursaria]
MQALKQPRPMRLVQPTLSKTSSMDYEEIRHLRSQNPMVLNFDWYPTQQDIDLEQFISCL